MKTFLIFLALSVLLITIVTVVIIDHKLPEPSQAGGSGWIEETDELRELQNKLKTNGYLTEDELKKASVGRAVRRMKYQYGVLP